MEKVYVLITEEGAYDDYMMSIERVYADYSDASEERDRLNKKYGGKNYFEATVETYGVE